MKSFTPQSAPQPVPQPVPMNAPLETSSVFAPMPLRARGVLEQLDLAVKVFRRYLGVLLSWSALVLGMSTIVGLVFLVFAAQSLMQASQFSAFPGAANQGAVLAALESFSRLTSIFLISGIFIFLGFPLIFGAVACAVTAAVRGQKIEFEQCWAFIKPRYGGMLLQIFLAILLGFVAAFGASFAFGIIIILGGLLVTALGRSASALGVIVGVLGAIALYLGLVVLFMALYLWMMMIPIVACMEDNRRSSGAIGRASALMRGGWWRAAGLMLLIGIAIWLVQIMVIAIAGLLTGRVGAAAQMSLMFLIYMTMCALILPFYAVVAGLFYLDQRVRNEALDLEWASYAGSELNAASPTVSPANEYSNASFGTSQTSTYAPVSTSPGYSPTPTATRADADNNRNLVDASFVDASLEDLASMPLDALTAEKTASNDEIARARAGTVATTNVPQYPQNDATLNAAPPETSFAVSSSTGADVPGNDATTTQQNEATPPGTTKTCAQCGAQLTAAQNFCLSCGARL